MHKHCSALLRAVLYAREARSIKATTLTVLLYVAVAGFLLLSASFGSTVIVDLPFLHSLLFLATQIIISNKANIVKDGTSVINLDIRIKV